MSKSPKITANGDTAILCLGTDLSSAADAILTLASKHRLSKPALLNILTAQICGEKHDWGFVKHTQSPLVSKRAKPVLDSVLTALSASNNANSQPDLSDLDDFTLACIEQARDAFISCAEGGDPDLGEIIEASAYKEVYAAIDQAAREFIEDHFGLPVNASSRFRIETLGKSELISHPIIDGEWDRLIEILDPEGGQKVDNFTQHCIDVAYDAFTHITKTDAYITENADLFEASDLNAACMKAARSYIEDQFGMPVEDHSRGEIQQFGDEQSITNIVIDSYAEDLHNILDIEHRRAIRDELDAISEDPFTRECVQHAFGSFDHIAETDNEIRQAVTLGQITDDDVEVACMRAAVQMVSDLFGDPINDQDKALLEEGGVFETINAIVIREQWFRLHDLVLLPRRNEKIEQTATDQPKARQERPSVTPVAPGTLGALGRNPGAFMPAKTKIIGYQVWSKFQEIFWDGRNDNEVLSAAAAETAMAEAKKAGCGDDFVIISIREGTISNPIFVD
jgi:hypothetical protein